MSARSTVAATERPAEDSTAGPTAGPAIPLAEFPSVQDVLRRAALGRLLPGTLRSPMGRNLSWIGSTDTGREVFVKKLVGPAADVAVRMRRMVSFEAHRAGLDALSAPTLLARDADHGIVVFEQLTATRHLAVSEPRDLGAALVTDLGTALGALHGSAPRPDVEYDTGLPELPVLDDLDALPLDRFYGATWGELEAVRLQQNDTDLLAALHRLRATEAAAVAVPSHCDLRLDQILQTADGVQILDWEEFRLADPARDLGSLVGELLHRAIRGIVRQDDDSTGAELDHDTVVARGVAEISAVRPTLELWWAAYGAAGGRTTPAVAARATAFAGWHLYDRLLAGARFRSTLAAIDRAAAGIGRMMVLQSERFAPAIGLVAGAR